MNNNLVSYEVAESPKKTTGVIVGVTLVVLGIGAVVLYFVRESAKRTSRWVIKQNLI